MSKAKILSIAFAAVLVLTLAVGGTVLADEGDTTTPPVCDEQSARVGGLQGGFIGSCTADIAELLELTTEEIRDLRMEGQSLADIAAAQGVSEAELVAVITSGVTENLNEKVAEGVITQERADAMLTSLTERVETMITATTPVMGQARFSNGENSDAYQAGFRKGFSRGFKAGYTTDGELPADTGRWQRGFAPGTMPGLSN
jgi:hypothetical protein